MPENIYGEKTPFSIPGNKIFLSSYNELFSFFWLGFYLIPDQMNKFLLTEMEKFLSFFHIIFRCGADGYNISLHRILTSFTCRPNFFSHLIF